MFHGFQPYQRPQLVADVAHQVVDVAGVGVPVLGRAVFELGDHDRRRGSAFGSLRRRGLTGSGSGGIPSAEVWRSGFFRGGGPHVPSLRGLAEQWRRAGASQEEYRQQSGPTRAPSHPHVLPCGSQANAWFRGWRLHEPDVDHVCLFGRREPAQGWVESDRLLVVFGCLNVLTVEDEEQLVLHLDRRFLRPLEAPELAPPDDLARLRVDERPGAAAC